jgi:hypothetical protein
MGHHIPSRIDRSYISDLGFSESSSLTIKAALRFLDLVDTEHEPTERLRKLAEAKEEDRKARLREMIEEAYRPVLVGLDLQTATMGLLQERFDDYGADRNVGHKCVSFFLALAKDAGIPLSPNLLNKSRIGALQKPSVPSVNVPVRRRRPVPSTSRTQPTGQGNISAYSPLASKLPDFDPSWPKDVRDQWLEHFQSLQTVMAIMEKFPSFNAQWPEELQAKWFDSMKELIARSSTSAGVC